MDWTLRRAFGPPEIDFRDVPDGETLFRAARGLDLAARIGSRCGAGALAAEIGAAAAGEFLAASRSNADEAILHSLAAQDVALAARELSVPLVYLKFQALTSAGYVPGAARGTSDVDVLLPAADAEDFRGALLKRGYLPSGCPDYEHQTSAVIHPFGVSVDLHRKLLGVRLNGRRSADARELFEGGLCVPLAGSPGEPAVPAREVLVAHALVHGVAQHGLAPQSYPLLRMVADLVDLGFPDASLASGWERWIARDVSDPEIDAVARLCARLRSGQGASGAGGDERAFLGHVLAAGDPEYSRSLKLDNLLREPTDRSRAGKLARSIGRALFSARPGERGWRGFRSRLSRPWVLLGRVLR